MSITIEPTTLRQHEWPLAKAEQFQATPSGGRKILVDTASFWPAEPDHVWVEGPIIRKSTGKPGTYRSRGYVPIDMLPKSVLVRVVSNWLGSFQA